MSLCNIVSIVAYLPTEKYDHSLDQKLLELDIIRSFYQIYSLDFPIPRQLHSFQIAPGRSDVCSAFVPKILLDFWSC